MERGKSRSKSKNQKSKNKSRSSSPVRKKNNNNLIENKKKQDKKITLYVLTRDFRTKDNLTLYSAYDESLRSGSELCVIFRFSPDQIDPEKNLYFSSFAFEFMIESLENLSKEINFTWLEPISDEEFTNFLLTLPIHKIYITRDFTPFARKRFEFFSSLHETIEKDDITVHPIEDYKTYHKINHFVDCARRMEFPIVEVREINWLKVSNFLSDYSFLPKFFNKSKSKSNLTVNDFLHKSGEEKISDFIPYEHKKNPVARPSDLNKLLDNLAENIKGYSQKKVRESVGSPKVSHLSPFIKFGLVSIRYLHSLVKDMKGTNSEDITEFDRELYCKDFFYRLAWDKPQEVFEKPNWQGKVPRFINEEDMLRFKKEKQLKETISKEEFKDIEAAKKIYDTWTKGETESPLINAAMKQMIQTGYMLNRTRMLTTSYLSQDHGLWWKYAERFFANNLIDYDWIVNAVNHQNIAKVGPYPKITQNFSIKRQESMNLSDKERYYNKYK
jgi:deoxyribodipyrimidine photo-lyase